MDAGWGQGRCASGDARSAVGIDSWRRGDRRCLVAQRRVAWTASGVVVLGVGLRQKAEEMDEEREERVEEVVIESGEDKGEVG